MPNSLFNRFVQSLGAFKRPKESESAQVHLAVFGKHPGWPDHIPGLGLSQPALIQFNQWLYKGISRNVDNGEWDRLKKSGQLLPFGHTLLSKSGQDVIVARCWNSVDEKGRDAYPMIAAVLCSRLPMSWIAREVMPALSALQAQLTAATTAAEVEQQFHAAESAVRQTVPADAAAPDAASSADAFYQLADCAELGPEHLRFLRVLYHIERELPSDVTGSKSSPQKSALSPRSFGLRVPPCADSGLAAAEIWLRFLSGHPDLPPFFVACVPDAASWIDLNVGVPTGAHLFCLRAPPDVLPMTTDIPYTLDADFISRVSSLIQNRQNTNGKSPASSWPLGK